MSRCLRITLGSLTRSEPRPLCTLWACLAVLLSSSVLWVASGCIREPLPRVQVDGSNDARLDEKPPGDLGVLGQIGGDAYAVAAQGTRVYLGVGPRVLVLDAADASRPKVLGMTEPFPGVVMRVEAIGKQALVVDRVSRLHVVDVSDLQDPRVLGSYERVGAVSVSNDEAYAYFARREGDITICRVGANGLPVELGSVSLGHRWYAAETVGGCTYVAVGERGVAVVPVDGRVSSDKVDVVATEGGAYGLAAHGDHVYVCGSGGEVSALDATKPPHPNVVGHIVAMGWAKPLGAKGSVRMATDGQLLYLTADAAGVSMVDIADPKRPQAVGFHPLPGALGIATGRGIVCVAGATTAQLHILTTSGSRSIREAGHFSTLGPAICLASTGGSLCVVNGDPSAARLTVVDTSRPALLTEMGSCSLPGTPFAAASRGDYVYVASGKAGVVVVHAAEGAEPRKVAECPVPLSATGVAVAGDYAYVIDSLRGLLIFDVSNPAHPRRVAEHGVPHGGAVGVAAAAGHAYLFRPGWGLSLVDVSVPAHPRGISFLDMAAELPAASTGVTMGRVVVSDPWAFVGDQDAGIWCIDVSDPRHPHRVTYYRPPTQTSRTSFLAFALRAVGSYAYVACGDHGVRVVDMLHSGGPKEIAFLDTPGLACDVLVAGDYAYVCDGDGGLCVTRADPGAPSP